MSRVPFLAPRRRTTTPGLDPTTLAALAPAPRIDLEPILARIRTHLDAHGGYVAFSGGKDSLATLALTRQVDPRVPVVHFDSGLEYPQTTTYIHDLADRWDLNLHVLHATPSALDILAASASWDHHTTRTQDTPDLFETVIAAPARHAHHLFGPGEIWGVRATESHGRACAYGVALRRNAHLPPGTPRAAIPTATTNRWGGIIHRLDGTVALGPVWNWTTRTIRSYLATEQIPLNPVYAHLERLGVSPELSRVSMMIDGGNLDAGRAVWLRTGWPHEYQRLLARLPRLAEFA